MVDIVYTKGFFAVYYDGRQFTSLHSSVVTGSALNIILSTSVTPNTSEVEQVDRRPAAKLRQFPRDLGDQGPEGVVVQVGKPADVHSAGWPAVGGRYQQEARCGAAMLRGPGDEGFWRSRQGGGPPRGGRLRWMQRCLGKGELRRCLRLREGAVGGGADVR